MLSNKVESKFVAGLSKRLNSLDEGNGDKPAWRQPWKKRRGPLPQRWLGSQRDQLELCNCKTTQPQSLLSTKEECKTSGARARILCSLAPRGTSAVRPNQHKMPCSVAHVRCSVHELHCRDQVLVSFHFGMRLHSAEYVTCVKMLDQDSGDQIVARGKKQKSKKMNQKKKAINAYLFLRLRWV